MVVILRENYNEEQRDNLVNWLESLGITVHSSLGEHNTVLGLVGDTSGIDIDLIKLSISSRMSRESRSRTRTRTESSIPKIR